MGYSLNTHSVGATSIAVGLSAIIEVAHTAKCIKRTIFDFSGGGSLYPQNASTDDVASGIDISDNASFTFEGPAKFFLSAAGATMTVKMIEEFSAGA